MGDSLLAQRDLDQILLSILYTLGDGGGYLVGLSKTITYDTVLIAYNDDGCKAEVTTTLGVALLAILWNSSFKWGYLSFSPLLFTSLLFKAICKASSDSHFDFCISFPRGWS